MQVKVNVQSKKRIMAKDAYYFPHDSNAQHDEKILKLRVKYGWAGYGLYWAIIERLREARNYQLDSHDIAWLSHGLSHPIDDLIAYLKDCYIWHLFTNKDGFFYSESLRKRMKEIDNRREQLSDAGKRGNLIRWQGNRKAMARRWQGNRSKVKESKVKESKYVGPKIPDENFLKTLKNNPAYKLINIDQELSKMDAWLLTHPGRQKTRRFIVNWLNRVDMPVMAPIKHQDKQPEPINPSERARVVKLIHETAVKMNHPQR